MSFFTLISIAVAAVLSLCMAAYTIRLVYRDLEVETVLSLKKSYNTTKMVTYMVIWLVIFLIVSSFLEDFPANDYLNWSEDGTQLFVIVQNSILIGFNIRNVLSVDMPNTMKRILVASQLVVFSALVVLIGLFHNIF